MSPKLALWWLVFVLAFGLTGCSGMIQRVEQPLQDHRLPLGEGHPLGQTFTTRYAGLAGVSLFLEPGEADSGGIILHLRRNPQETSDLRTTRIDLSSLETKGRVSFQFEPLADPAFNSYYLLLEMDGGGEAYVGTAGGEAYLDGALYQDGVAQDAQLYFGLLHSRIPLMAGLLREILGWLGWLAAGVFLFLIPGWALLSAAWPGWGSLNWGEKIGLGFGTGLAIGPLLLLFCDLGGLSPGKMLAWLPGICGGIYLAWKAWRGQRYGGLPGRRSNPFRLIAPKIEAGALSAAVLGLTLVLIVFTRFWAIRAVEVPMWGDSVQHAVIAQLILDQGGLFSSWEPYAPYSTLTVHFGFPAHSALFAWLTGLPSQRATLVTAQLVNALAVICLLPLSYRLSKGSHWAAAATLSAAGLLSAMPAFYINWGRFAQLDGQAILATGLWLAWDLLQGNREHAWTPDEGDQPAERTAVPEPARPVSLRRLLFPCLLAGAVFAGMTLTYYRMPFYAVTFFLALLIAWLIGGQLRKALQWGMILGVATLISAAMLLFMLPWLPRLSGSALSGMVVQGISGEPATQRLLTELGQWKGLAGYLPPILAVLSICGLIWSLVRKNWETAAFGLWVVLLQLFQAGRLLNLPGANMLQVFAILIWLYFPASLLCGWLSGEIAAWLMKRTQLAGEVLLASLYLLAALMGANQARLIAHPVEYGMVTRPDLRAMDWIRRELPPEATFLVEGSLINEGRSVVGTDAGWWLPLLSLRRNTMPPQYALINEVPSEEGQSQQYVDLVAALEAAPPSDPAVIDLLCKAGVTHVYVGQRWGAVGAVTKQLYTPADLLDQPGYTEVYHQDRVYIFALDSPACNR